jgi:glucose-6-phosphate dehydrogenase assembly protein OpcA
MWGGAGIKSLLYAPKGTKYNATFLVELVVPDLVEHVWWHGRQKTLRSIIVHVDKHHCTTGKKGRKL